MKEGTEAVYAVWAEEGVDEEVEELVVAMVVCGSKERKKKRVSLEKGKL